MRGRGGRVGYRRFGRGLGDSSVHNVAALPEEPTARWRRGGSPPCSGEASEVRQTCPASKQMLLILDEEKNPHPSTQFAGHPRRASSISCGPEPTDGGMSGEPVAVATRRWAAGAASAARSGRAAPARGASAPRRGGRAEMRRWLARGIQDGTAFQRADVTRTGEETVLRVLAEVAFDHGRLRSQHDAYCVQPALTRRLLPVQ